MTSAYAGGTKLAGAARPIGYYAPAPFAFLEWLGRTFRFGPYAFKVPVGEMEARARRES